MAKDVDVASLVRVAMRNGRSGERGYITAAQWLPWLRRTIEAAEAAEGADENAPPVMTVPPCVVCGQPVSEVHTYKHGLLRHVAVRVEPCDCRVIQRFKLRWKDIL